ncbi:hypothetical protein PUNSTDRAFT_48187 [Punctularia strigosozonata HHB-11173 SS5]|uniref:uncharacterized protein n=1 Tax=Punctularia strigosozonata (strain HHB-11173) TaxID=741275 RepID=UPI00044165BE|nr:uncharacterized protein PUNSTDRAFT_48187 [Punctularia strigosozonata HHB-11173 SS5]EIN13112.1 hypothetical protein PUNSTDRAFT_48187 [Punctularia strigosozonata HHB-11173 SS5]
MRASQIPDTLSGPLHPLGLLPILGERRDGLRARWVRSDGMGASVLRRHYCENRWPIHLACTWAPPPGAHALYMSREYRRSGPKGREPLGAAAAAAAAQYRSAVTA